MAKSCGLHARYVVSCRPRHRTRRLASPWSSALGCIFGAHRHLTACELRLHGETMRSRPCIASRRHRVLFYSSSTCRDGIESENARAARVRTRASFLSRNERRRQESTRRRCNRGGVALRAAPSIRPSSSRGRLLYYSNKQWLAPYVAFNLQARRRSATTAARGRSMSRRSSFGVGKLWC